MTFMIIVWTGELFKYKIKCSGTSRAVDGWACPSCASNLGDSIKSLKLRLFRSQRIPHMRGNHFFRQSVRLCSFGFRFLWVSLPGAWRDASKLFRTHNNDNKGEGGGCRRMTAASKADALVCYHGVQNNLWLGESSEPSKLILLFQWNCLSLNGNHLSLLLGCCVLHGSHAALTSDPLSPQRLPGLRGIHPPKAQSLKKKSQLSLTPRF